MPGGAPTGGVSQEGVFHPLEQPVSPAGASLETALAGSPPLQQQKHSRLDMTPAASRAGTAAHSYVRRNANNTFAAINTGPALSKLRGLRLCTEAILPGIAHDMYGVDSAVEYAGTATHIKSRSAGKNAEIMTSTFKEAMSLLAKAQWKTVSTKEVPSLKHNNTYTLLPVTFVPTGHNIIGSRWVYMVKADTSHKGRVVVSGWG